jgi:hypothetical protein
MGQPCLVYGTLFCEGLIPATLGLRVTPSETEQMRLLRSIETSPCSRKGDLCETSQVSDMGIERIEEAAAAKFGHGNDKLAQRLQ